jgi:hypothetical protein
VDRGLRRLFFYFYFLHHGSKAPLLFCTPAQVRMVRRLHCSSSEPFILELFLNCICAVKLGRREYLWSCGVHVYFFIRTRPKKRGTWHLQICCCQVPMQTASQRGLPACRLLCFLKADSSLVPATLFLLEAGQVLAHEEWVILRLIACFWSHFYKSITLLQILPSTLPTPPWSTSCDPN